LLARAKLEGLHIHDLRRSLASFMANAGADVSLIQSALNHKDIKTTLTVYVRTARSAELTAREKAHDLLRKLADTDSARGKSESSGPFGDAHGCGACPRRGHDRGWRESKA
jgi:hypothetical protein